MGTPDDPPFADGLGYLLARVGALSERSWLSMLSEIGISPLEYGVILLTDQQGAQTQAALGKSLAVDPRNMGPVMDRLESRALIVRRVSPQDRRQRTVELTTDGRAVAASIAERSALVTEDFFAPLSAAERNQLTDLLRRLHHARTQGGSGGI